jgi:hypothetical protein
MATLQHSSDRPGVGTSQLATADPANRAAPGRRQEARPGAAHPDQTPAAQGLVICAINVRDLETPAPEVVPDDLSGLSIRDVWRPRFPGAELVGLAAGNLRELPTWMGQGGIRWSVVVSPGALAVEAHDRARLRDTAVRARVLAARHGPLPAAVEGAPCSCGDTEHDGIAVRGEITEWSRKSRAGMFRAFCELDYAPLLALDGIPATVTLTYPGEWLSVAPNGRAAKRHWAAFKARWVRAWGTPLVCLWKFEFQRRGAPHLAFLTVVPSGRSPEGLLFRPWVSMTWAAVVAHPDPEQRRRHELAGTNVDPGEGLRARDPRRIAVYFSKHGTFAAKEYQNRVPVEWQAPGQGPGRFWGYTGMRRTTVVAEVTPDSAVLAGRTLRRWARAQTNRQGVPLYRIAKVRRVSLATGVARYRNVKRRPVRLASGHGWVSLNDAPGFGLDLARYLSGERDQLGK